VKLFVVCTQQYLTFCVISYLAGQGASQVRTQGQVALGPDLVAIRIPAPVLASQVPVVAARVHLHRDLTSPAPLTGTTVAYSAVSLPRNKYSRLNTVYVCVYIYMWQMSCRNLTFLHLSPSHCMRNQYKCIFCGSATQSVMFMWHTDYHNFYELVMNTCLLFWHKNCTL